jgi:hypothetical protein
MGKSSRGNVHIRTEIGSPEKGLHDTSFIIKHEPVREITEVQLSQHKDACSLSRTIVIYPPRAPPALNIHKMVAETEAGAFTYMLPAGRGLKASFIFLETLLDVC